MMNTVPNVHFPVVVARYKNSTEKPVEKYQPNKIEDNSKAGFILVVVVIFLVLMIRDELK